MPFGSSGAYRDIPKLLRSDFALHYLRMNGIVSAANAYGKQSGQWMRFDDPASIVAKAHDVTTDLLGGMLMWEPPRRESP